MDKDKLRQFYKEKLARQDEMFLAACKKNDLEGIFFHQDMRKALRILIDGLDK